MRNYLLAGVAAATLAGSSFIAPTASASAVSLNTWYYFGFNDPNGSALMSGLGFVAATNAPDGNPIVQAPDPAWTITSAVPLTLTVQDLFQPIDQFNISNNAASLGLTSVPSNNTNVNCGSDITACIASLGNSRGTFLLPAGSDSITGIRDCTANCVAGAAVFELTAATPLPATLPLFATGLGGLGLLGWRRKRKAQAVA